jgi:hypothetical protein
MSANASFEEKAPDGHVWVCHACGKRSKDKFGLLAMSYGWDESCMMNSELYKEEDLVIKDGFVVQIR